MNILTVCHFGKNRSKYLAEYLREKGYGSDFKGVGDVSQNPVTQKEIDWADVLVFVKPEIQAEFFRKFDKPKNKKVICLDVEDRTSVLCPKPLRGESWIDFQRNCVYPELKRQIDKYLPF